MSSTVIRVPRITGFPIIIAGLISIRSVVIAIPFTHHSALDRVAQSPLASSSPNRRGKHLVCPWLPSQDSRRARREEWPTLSKSKRESVGHAPFKLGVRPPP